MAAGFHSKGFESVCYLFLYSLQPYNDYIQTAACSIQVLYKYFLSGFFSLAVALEETQSQSNKRFIIFTEQISASLQMNWH